MDRDLKKGTQVAMPRHIKRYANRKLYDVTERRYITLDEIGGFIQAGEEVQVTDKTSGNDITEQVLSKVVAATVQQPSEGISRNALISFIQHPSDMLYGYVRKTVTAGFDTVQQIDRQFERVGKLLRDALRPNANGKAPEAEEIAPALRSVIEAFVEQCVVARIAELDLPSRAEFNRLQQRVATLEKQLRVTASIRNGVSEAPAVDVTQTRKRVRTVAK
jgi:polyhydroxyalkanoate synthesis repressor PhaR